VGRAGHIIANTVRNALHIRFIAPLNYRVNTIMHNNNLSREEAIDFIQRVEKERMAFRKSILKQFPQDEMFDITLNRAAFSDDEMIELIELAAKRKNVLPNV
jgi:cytidylate kinase